MNIEIVMSGQEIFWFSSACVSAIAVSVIIARRAYQRMEVAAGLLSLLVVLSVVLVSGLSAALFYPGPLYFANIRTGVGLAGAFMLILGSFGFAEIIKHESIGSRLNVFYVMSFGFLLMIIPHFYFSIETAGL